VTGSTSRAVLTGAAMLMLALTAGCSTQSGGSGSALFGGGPAPAAAAGTTSTSTATNTTSTTSPTNAAPINCTPQTADVSADSAREILATLTTELPKACGFTVSGYLDGAAELPNGLPIEGSASVDAAGNVHVGVQSQGIVADVYVVSGAEYVHLYEPGQPDAAPDADVQESWGSVLTSAQVAAAGAKYVKLTSAQQAAFATAGMGGDDALLAPDRFAADLTSTSPSSGWTLAGSATVNGVPCVQISAPGGEGAPATEISVDAATGLPIELTYTASPGAIPNTLSFSDYDKTAAVNLPGGVVDGASLG
jgi:hypothetical protein